MDRVCVYCGSSRGRQPAYAESAERLGRTLVDRGLGVVYGGASVGVMGALADAVIDGGGEAIGVIPEALLEREVAHPGLSDLHVVESMHERKRRMVDLADGFVALPGGFGTLEELIEVLTWAQLGFHRHPCGLLNVEGYFDGLVDFFDHAVAEGFVSDAHREMLAVETDPDQLLDRFERYEAPPVKRVVSEGEET